MSVRRTLSWDGAGRHCVGAGCGIARAGGSVAGAKVIRGAGHDRSDSPRGAAVVWAHNTHVGDARATDRGTRNGYLSLGQLVRERHAGDTIVVGFTTRLGTVRAAPSWGEADRVYNLRRPAWESVPAIFGRAQLPQFMLVFAETGTQLDALDDNVPLRAIGVVYAPKLERSEHYYRGRLTQQFDAIVHIDRTQALPRLPGN